MTGATVAPLAAGCQEALTALDPALRLTNQHLRTCVRTRSTGVPVAELPSGALAGLRVADFSRILAGPYASMLLADLGAEVVKVESPAGDDTRSWMPPVRDEVSTYYLG